MTNVTFRNLSKIIRRSLLLTCSILLTTSTVVHSSGNNTIQFKRGVYSTLSSGRSLLTDTHQSSKSQIVNTLRQYTIIQFEKLPSDLEKAQLAEQGIELLEYISDKAYWVKLNNKPETIDRSKIKAPTQQTQSFQLWMPPDEVKVSFELEEALTDHDIDLFNVTAIFQKGVSKSFMEQKLHENGVVSKINWIGAATAKISTNANSIRNVIAFDELKWIELQAPADASDNIVAAQRIKVDRITSTPLSLNGNGITIGVWEGGSVGFHNDINDRVTILTNQPETSHSTRVTGTAIGSGAGNAEARGMAPQAKVRNRSFRDLNYENDVIDEAQKKLIDIANFSFGTSLGWTSRNGELIDLGRDSVFGSYSADTRTYDSIAHKQGLLIFKSAGNNRNDCNPNNASDCDGDDGGYDSIPHKGTAKNIVTVGATDDTDNISSFSGWGPTNDGRIKPDLCANGTSLITTIPNNQYQSTSGTSFSTPSAAGAAALLYQHYNNLYNALPDDPALIKGAMIHSAAEFGPNAGPDPVCGWGLIDAEIAAQLISQEAFITGSASQGTDIDVATISVPQNTNQVKVTLVWTDPEGNPSASTALVNNLDLRIIDSANNEYLPWRLDSNDGYRTAIRGINTRDNVEQITIDNPSPGDYIIRIQGGGIPSGPQAYVLFSELVGNAVSTEADELCFPVKDAAGALTLICF